MSDNTSDELELDGIVYRRLKGKVITWAGGNFLEIGKVTEAPKKEAAIEAIHKALTMLAHRLAEVESTLTGYDSVNTIGMKMEQLAAAHGKLVDRLGKLPRTTGAQRVARLEKLLARRKK